ncbi:uncharacterized protein LOC116346714 [Contarinia nasturtii]|uniref:uncharacterized protein LOC116346714 n=1 Tax=Contarinia nasturtii TaxID=265458 RepID=UPI0012D43EB8|nr:uncharacterized protein LOC116346714 [Contarinia nasturtii]
MKKLLVNTQPSRKLKRTASLGIKATIEESLKSKEILRTRKKSNSLIMDKKNEMARSNSPSLSPTATWELVPRPSSSMESRSTTTPVKDQTELDDVSSSFTLLSMSPSSKQNSMLNRPLREIQPDELMRKSSKSTPSPPNRSAVQKYVPPKSQPMAISNLNNMSRSFVILSPPSSPAKKLRIIENWFSPPNSSLNEKSSSPTSFTIVSPSAQRNYQSTPYVTSTNTVPLPSSAETKWMEIPLSASFMAISPSSSSIQPPSQSVVPVNRFHPSNDLRAQAFEKGAFTLTAPKEQLDHNDMVSIEDSTVLNTLRANVSELRPLEFDEWIENEEKQLAELDEEAKKKCLLCEKTFTHLFGRERHMKLHEVPHMRYKCKKCKDEFITKSGFNVHAHLMHNNVKPSEIKFEMTVNSSLIAPFFANLPQPTLPMPNWPTDITPLKWLPIVICAKVECSQPFLTKFGLIKHLELHERHQERYTCFFCDGDFWNNMELKVHTIRNHQAEGSPMDSIPTRMDRIAFEKDVIKTMEERRKKKQSTL